MNKKAIEKNKLILEFMGFRPQMQGPDRYHWNDAPFFYCTKGTPEEVLEGVAGYVKYDKSIDALLHILDKIEKEHGYVLVMSLTYSYWTHTDNEPNPFFDDYGGYENVSNIYEQVVRMIEFLNNKNK